MTAFNDRSYQAKSAASEEGRQSDKVYESADATVSCRSYIWKHFDSLVLTKRKEKI